MLPGVEDTLKFAKKAGYKLTVLSNGEKFMQNHRLELAGIKDYFDLIVTSEEAHYSKPDEHAFNYFFSRTEIGPNDPALISGIWGMNVGGLPGKEDDNGFWLVMSMLSTIFSVGQK